MLSKALNHLFRLSRTQKRLIQLAVDTLLITVSFVLAMFLRFDTWTFLSNPKLWWVVPVVIPVEPVVFMRLGFYRAFIRYMSMQAAVAIGAGVFVSMVVMMVMNYLALPVPRSVPVIYAMMTLLTIGGIRILLRGLHQHGQLRYKTHVLAVWRRRLADEWWFLCAMVMSTSLWRLLMTASCCRSLLFWV